MADDGELPEVWQAVVCPSCKGKGEIYYEGYDEYDSGMDRCGHCSGKKFVKINVSELNER